MAKIDIDLTSSVEVTNYNRYLELASIVSKNASELSEFQALQAAYADKMIVAADYNGLEDGIADNADGVSDSKRISVYGDAGGTANAITVVAPYLTLVDGASIKWKQQLENTSTVTVNANSTGVKQLRNRDGVPLSSGDLEADRYYEAIYDLSNDFFVLAPRGTGGDATAGEVLAGSTFTNDDGEQVGVMVNNGATSYTPSTSNQTVDQGYHNGSGIVVGDTDLVSDNIKSGASIFGVLGDSNVVDTTGGNLVPQYLLAGYQGYSDGSLVSGTMVDREGNNTATGSSVSTNTLRLTAPVGFYDGGDTVQLTDNDWITSNIKVGTNIFGKVGTYTSDANAVVSQLLSGRTAYVNGVKVTGTMPDREGNNNRTAQTTVGTQLRLTAPTGFYDGSDTVYDDDPNRLASNIKKGVSLDGLTGTLGAIKSIQQGIYNHTGGDTNPGNSIDVSITAVSSISNCMVIATNYFGSSSGGKTGRNQLVDGYLSTTSNLKLDFDAFSSDVDNRIYWQVIEFEGVSSQQTGQVTTTVITTSDVTISPVDLSKSLVWCGSKGNYSGGYAADTFLGYGLSSSTNLKIDAYYSQIVRWHVIEFE